MNSAENSSQAGNAAQAEALVLAPAVLRMVIAGGDMDAEIDALTQAVAILQSPDAALRVRVYEMATDLALAVSTRGIADLADTVKAGLDRETLAEGVRLGLAAIFLSPDADDGDIGIMAGVAERLGVPEDEFSQLYKSAKAAVANA